jgi:hypothetical protein
MNKEFVNYEESLTLKELGFDEPCFGFYTYKGEIRRYTNFDEELNDFQTLKNSSITLGDNWCTAPLYQQCWRWFREKHELRTSNYRCSIKKEGGIVIGDGFRIFKYGKDTISTIEKETYEEAELECLKKLIEITKTK